MELLATLVLIFGTGFYAGSETALYRANWVRLVNWLNRHVAGAGMALQCLDNRDQALITTIVGTNLCSVFATAIASRFFGKTFGAAAAPIAIVLVVTLTLVLGEYLPKALAQAIPDRWLRLAGFILNASRIVFAPAVFGLTLISRLVLPRTADRHRPFTLTHQDFLAALRRRAGMTSSGEKIAGLVERLFRFSSTKVGELAIPLHRICSVPHDAGLSAVITAVRQNGYSRIPVYEGTPDNITGVILAKDMLFAPTFRIRRARRVSQDARAMDVLRELQRAGEHICLIVDSNDRVNGIVTLEDLLEELIGEIRSEA
ncbi:MAG: CNNM domain-containing protein [candidate division WOR-3 bacterium]